MIAPETNRTPEPLTSTTSYRSARPLALVLCILLLANAAVYLLGIVSALAQFGMLNEAASAGVFTAEQARAKVLRDGLIALLSAPVYLITIAFFCLWLHRAYSNLTALANPESHLEYSPGWAVGGFFIPVMHLYLPYRATAEIWRKSDPAIRTQDDYMFSAPGTAAFVLLWWIFWIACLVLDGVYGQLYNSASTPGQLLLVTKMGIVAQAVALVAAVLGALVVHGITRRQDERSKHVVFTPHLPPPPPLFTPPPPQQVTVSGR
jgi:hypothetical protein